MRSHATVLGARLHNRTGYRGLAVEIANGHSRGRVHARSRARRRHPLPPVIEGMEQRQLLTGTAFGISGAASTAEGSNYLLNLTSSGPGASTVDHWTVDWGDGTLQNVPGSPANASHTYADGVADRTVTATATNADGTFAARNGPAVNDADLDPSFGAGTGKIKSTSIGYTAAAALPGGKFLVAGTKYTGSTSGHWDNFWVGRFNADGTPDTTFGPGGDGTATADFAGRDDFGTALLVQSDGRIVVGGRSLNSNGSLGDFALARFNADGSLDDGTANDTTAGDSFGGELPAAVFAGQCAPGDCHPARTATGDCAP